MATFTRENTLLVFALADEEHGQFDGFSKIHCGVGKVNAAYRLMRALAAWRSDKGAAPACVINLGSAGSPVFKSGSLVNCTGFIQRDMDTTALGTPAYGTLGEADGDQSIIGLRWDAYPKGICGTGDNFVTDGAAQIWNTIDMEAYALAKVCALEKIPFGCLKFITDGADGHAAATWEASLAEAALSLRAALKSLVSE